MLLKTVGLGELLREPLAQKQAKLAIIFGSMAAGEEREGSDVDLLVVGNLRPRALSDLLGQVENSVGREINSIALTPSEFAARMKAGDQLLTAVMAGPKIFLIGDEDEAARLAE